MLDLAVPQRQSPLAIVFLGLRLLRSLGLTQLVILALFIVRGPFGGPLVLVPSAAILVLGAVSALAWWRYTFQVVDGELVVHKGVFRMDRLTVPIERIQSIAIDQALLHRVTGLVKVVIDTAGSAAAEFTIDAISRPVAESLQRATVTEVHAAANTPGPLVPGAALPPPLIAAGDGAHDGGDEGAGVSAGDRVVFTHGAGRLFITAITAWPLAGLLVLGPLFALGDDAIDQVLDRVPMLDDSRLDGGSFRWWFVPVGIVLFMLLSVILNIARVFLQDWNLTLHASSTSLRRTSGLLSRTSKATSVARVQVVSSRQNPLQRRAGVHQVELSNVGEGDLSLPGCDAAQFAMVSELGGSTPIGRISPARRIHPVQVWLRTRNAAIQAAVLAIGLYFAVGWWSILAFAFVPFVWLMQRRDVANFRWALGGELTTSRRVIDSETSQALLRKANSVRITQTIFERRRGLGRVHLVTAAGTVSVGMLPIAEACAVRDTVLVATETDSRPWM